MNSATWVKFLTGVLLFAAWLALVLMRIVPPGPLVDAIGYALVGLGIYHASANGSSASPLLASLLARVTPVAATAQFSAIQGELAAPAPASAPVPQEPSVTAAAAPAVPQAAAGTLQ
ncbi:hypothetical protein PQQ59_05820 [Paraburkholderia aspalathi]|uniref:hypothetical protein n=1 Tax=Paraburkholderia aspalathi TaxID=1324617 RepID=UPI0038B7F997